MALGGPPVTFGFEISELQARGHRSSALSIGPIEPIRGKAQRLRADASNHRSAGA